MKINLLLKDKHNATKNGSEDEEKKSYWKTEMGRKYAGEGVLNILVGGGGVVAHAPLLVL